MTDLISNEEGAKLRIRTVVAALAMSTLVSFGLATPAFADGEIVTLTNVNSSKCLTIAGGSGANIAPAVQYNCDGHAARLWLVDGDLNGYFRLVNVNSGKCLTIDGGSTANLAPAVQYNCDTHPSRQWRVVDAAGAGIQVVNRNSNKCITPDGGSLLNNAKVVQYTCDIHAARRWY